VWVLSLNVHEHELVTGGFLSLSRPPVPPSPHTQLVPLKYV